MPAPWDSQPSADPNCVDYTLAANGIEPNYFLCNQCAQNYIQTGNNGQYTGTCTQVTWQNDGTLNTVNLGTGAIDEFNSVGVRSWCFAYVQTASTNKLICSITRLKANTDIYAPLASTSTKVVNLANYCNDWNDASQTCNSADACLGASTFE